MYNRICSHRCLLLQITSYKLKAETEKLLYPANCLKFKMATRGYFLGVSQVTIQVYTQSLSKIQAMYKAQIAIFQICKVIDFQCLVSKQFLANQTSYLGIVICFKSTKNCMCWHVSFQQCNYRGSQVQIDSKHFAEPQSKSSCVCYVKSHLFMPKLINQQIYSQHGMLNLANFKLYCHQGTMWLQHPANGSNFGSITQTILAALLAVKSIVSTVWCCIQA